MLGLLEEAPGGASSVATTFRKRIESLTTERDELAEENRALTARLRGVGERAEALARQSSDELDEERRKRRESEEVRATLEVDLRAARGRVEALETEVRRREAEREEALARVQSFEAFGPRSTKTSRKSSHR